MTGDMSIQRSLKKVSDGPDNVLRHSVPHQGSSDWKSSLPYVLWKEEVLVLNSANCQHWQKSKWKRTKTAYHTHIHGINYTTH